MISRTSFSFRSQVTLFMILGMIIVIIVVASLMIASRYTQLFTATQTNEEFAQEIAIELCVQQAAEEGIDILAKQGGVLFNTPEQLGPYNFADTSRYVVHSSPTGVLGNVYKGIVQNSLTLDPPQYPFGNRDIFDLQAEYSSYSNAIWGKVELPPLIDFSLQQSLAVYARSQGIGQLTMQRQLQDYIRTHIQNCTDAEGQIMDWTSATFRVTLNDADVLVRATNVSFVDGQAVQVTVPVRLLKAHCHASRILLCDAINIHYDKNTQMNSVEGCGFSSSICIPDGSFAFDVLRSVGGGSGADILTVADLNSTISGRPLVFQTAIENRRPAMNLRTQINPPVPEKYATYAKLYAPLPMHLEYAQYPVQLRVDPQVYDADEDLAVVHYRGWGENNITLFDEQRCCKHGVCALADPSCYTQTALGTTDATWSTSPDYVLSSCGSEVCANFSFLPAHRGLHSIRLEAVDGRSPPLTDFREYSLLAGSTNDIMESVAVLNSIATVAEDSCVLFVDDSYETAVSSSTGPGSLRAADCADTPIVLPPAGSNAYNVTIYDRSGWITSCHITATADRIARMQALAVLSGRDPSAIILDDDVQVCHFIGQGSTIEQMTPYYTQNGPFWSLYDFRSPGYVAPGIANFPSTTHPLSCAAQDAAFVGVDSNLWQNVASVLSLPGASSTTKCKYIADDPNVGGIGCGCWKCTANPDGSGNCDLFIANR